MKITEWSKYEELNSVLDAIVWLLCGTILKYCLRPIEPLTYGSIIESSCEIRKHGAKAKKLYKEYVSECMQKGYEAQSPSKVVKELGFDNIPMIDDCLRSEYEE